MKKLVLPLIALLLVSAGVVAANEIRPDDTVAPAQEATDFRWAESGLRFDFPSDWTVSPQEGFEFVIVSPPDADTGTNSFIGLQQGPLGEETLESIIGQFEATVGAEGEEVEFGGVPAIRIDIPVTENNIQGVLIGFQPRDDEIAVLTIQGDAGVWDDSLGEVAENILESAEVTALDLDYEAINAQLKADLDAGEPLVIGDEDANIQMIEVLDWSCVHCVNYTRSVDRILMDYVMPGQAQLRLVFVDFVGAEASALANHAMFCAIDQEQGWQMHSVLANGYLENGGRSFYDLDLIRAAVVAQELDMDVDAWETCVTEGQFEDAIQADIAYAATLDVTSTPTIFFSVGGEDPRLLANSSGEALRGGIPLLTVYSFFDANLEAGG
jgi:protein-disulfide isomerase